MTDRRFTVSVCTRALCTYNSDSLPTVVIFPGSKRQGIHKKRFMCKLKTIKQTKATLLTRSYRKEDIEVQKFQIWWTCNFDQKQHFPRKMTRVSVSWFFKEVDKKGSSIDEVTLGSLTEIDIVDIYYISKKS